MDWKNLKKHWLLRIIFSAAALLSAYFVFFRMPLPQQLFPPAWMSGGILKDFQEDGLLNRFLEHGRRKLLKPDSTAFDDLKKEQHEIKRHITKYRFDRNFTPDIIFILNEAAFDPVKLQGVGFPGKSPFSVAELCKKIKYDAGYFSRSGSLRVPVFGGGTVNTEFEILTGISAFISPQMPYSHAAVRKIPSVASLLKQRGYKTSFLHPFTLSMYSRNKVLPNLGIDHLFDRSYFPDAAGDFPYYPDAPFYDKVIQYLQQNTDRPQFLFCVSIQNHGPYDTPRFRHVRQQQFSVKGKISKSDTENIQRYFTGLSLSYKALVSFFGSLRKKIKRPTLVVVFGDHLPILSNDDSIWDILIPNYKKKRFYTAYQTEYLVWSNYRLPYPEQIKKNMPAFELGKRTLFAAGALPYDGFIHLFEKLKNSNILLGKEAMYNILEYTFRGKKIEAELDNYLRMYHALCHNTFTGK